MAGSTWAARSRSRTSHFRRFPATSFISATTTALSAFDSDGEPTAGVARRLPFQVVGFLMDDQAAADDRVGAVKGEVSVVQVIRDIAARAGLDVAQVADVPL